MPKLTSSRTRPSPRDEASPSELPAGTAAKRGPVRSAASPTRSDDSWAFNPAPRENQDSPSSLNLVKYTPGKVREGSPGFLIASDVVESNPVCSGSSTDVAQSSSWPGRQVALNENAGSSASVVPDRK